MMGVRVLQTPLPECFLALSVGFARFTVPLPACPAGIQRYDQHASPNVLAGLKRLQANMRPMS